MAVYREHPPEISFYPGVTDTLRALSALGCIWAVTDGLASVQRRKVVALGLDRWVERVIYCQAVGCPKPDTGSLAGAIRQGARDVILIGDRPDHDLALAARMGLGAVRVRTGRFRNVPNHPWTPVADIPSFARLFG